MPPAAPIDLEAIRKRNAHGASADVDELLAEIERLRNAPHRLPVNESKPFGDPDFIRLLPSPPDGWRIRPNTSPTWLEVVDECSQETVVIKWDGCVHLDVYYNMAEPDDPESAEKDQNHNYVHLCGLREWLARMQRLCDYARFVGIYTE